jgi:DNA-directed RNA polymerase subunit RPC12/RpoP
MIKHKCMKCGKEILNKLSEDDNMDIYNNLNKNN